MQAAIHTLMLALIYPGVLWVLVLVLLVSIVQGRAGLVIRGIVGLRQETTPLSWVVAVLAAGGALALLPWAGVAGRGAQLALLWGLIEGSQLLVLLPGLSHPDPQVGREATRQAQITTAGRIVLWIGLAVAWHGAQAGDVVARLIGTAAALLALPVALQWPPFGPMRAMPWTASLARPTLPVAALCIATGEAILLALVATLAVVVPGIPTAAQGVAQIVVIIALAAIGRGLRGTVVEQRLAWGLRWWWNVLLPLAAVAAVALALHL